MRKILTLFLFATTLLLAGCDQCKEVTCVNGSTCEKGECQCDAGYSGERCEIEDKCITRDISCQNGGQCASGECDCPEGFSGSNCQVEDKCITDDPGCKNGGKCDDGECDCPAGYSGDRCEIKDPTIAPCDTVTCQNNQPCVDGSCLCDTWTSGTYCQNKRIDEHIEDLDGEWYCDGSFWGGFVNIESNTVDLRTLTFDIEIGGFDFVLEGEFTDYENFTFPEQEASGYTWTGYGYLSAGSWVIVVDDGITECTFYED